MPDAAQMPAGRNMAASQHSPTTLAESPRSVGRWHHRYSSLSARPAGQQHSSSWLIFLAGPFGLVLWPIRDIFSPRAQTTVLYYTVSVCVRRRDAHGAPFRGHEGNNPVRHAMPLHARAPPLRRSHLLLTAATARLRPCAAPATKPRRRSLVLVLVRASSPDPPQQQLNLSVLRFTLGTSPRLFSLHLVRKPPASSWSR